LLAICLRLLQGRDRLLDSLSANAYSIYLLHYVFVVWLQYALLGLGLFAVAKAAIVFCGTFVMSWAAAVAFGGLSLGAFFTQAKRWVPARVGQKPDGPLH
jgi:peptidoglycan/LPS O-acetylase OafA/YrhL